MHRPTVEITGPAVVLASRYDVTTLAAAAVSDATLAAADLLAARNDEPTRRVRVDRTAACAAFLGERLFRPDGWQLPPIWDPIAGDYRTTDGWIRLHTNYSHHRAAVLRALRLPADTTDRDAVAAVVRGGDGRALEVSVVAEGGPAGVLQSTAEWFASASGMAARRQRLISTPAASDGVEVPSPQQPSARLPSGRLPSGRLPSGRLPSRRLPPADLPLSGIRVLDLTRVIAGPVCTRFLAAYGAQVLRIDPPGFVEVPALLPEFTPGKRSASMDLRDGASREHFLSLVRQAHVLVSGLRDGALSGLGLGLPELRAANPSLITARLNAYGFDGPWRHRRGFDSLVQMSCGIAYLEPNSPPSPLPAQALDHASGYLLAAAVCRALRSQMRSGVPADVTTSLVATANLLLDLPVPPVDARRDALPQDLPWPDEIFEHVSTAWGPATRVRIPGNIEGVIPSWSVEAGPLGRDPAVFD